MEANASTTQLPTTIMCAVTSAQVRTPVLVWRRQGAGFVPDCGSTTRYRSELRRVAVIDGRTGEPATAEPHGPALRLLGFGGCELRMQHAMASYTVAAGRRLLQRSDWTGVIPPMVAVATSVGLTETDAP